MKRRPLRVVDGMARRKQSPSCNGKGNGSNASNGSYGESRKTAVVVDGNGMESHDRKSRDSHVEDKSQTP